LLLCEKRRFLGVRYVYAGGVVGSISDGEPALRRAESPWVASASVFCGTVAARPRTTSAGHFDKQKFDKQKSDKQKLEA
jgi:hypothetical protein